jgi:hypothetical protein
LNPTNGKTSLNGQSSTFRAGNTCKKRDKLSPFSFPVPVPVPVMSFSVTSGDVISSHFGDVISGDATSANATSGDVISGDDPPQM